MTPAASTATSGRPVEALNRLVDISTSYMASQVFFTACRLGVFEKLADGPGTAAELSPALGIDTRGCERLLAVLRNLGLVARDGDQYYNTDAGSYCTSRSAIPMEALSIFGDPFYRIWECLPDALREYSPRWKQAVGTTADEVFAALYEDPVRLRRFVALTDALGAPQGIEIAESFNFAPYECILDVAGGSGSVIASIIQRHPHLRGIVMDLLPVCQLAAENMERKGLAGRVTTAVADLFAGPYPAGANVITLGYILHDWSDEKCRVILKHCFDALPSGGVLLVSEKVLNNDSTGERWALLSDLHMLLCCEPGAKERSETEYRLLLEGAGFRDIEIVRLDAPRDMVVAYKP